MTKEINILNELSVLSDFLSDLANSGKIHKNHKCKINIVILTSKMLHEKISKMVWVFSPGALAYNRERVIIC